MADKQATVSDCRYNSKLLVLCSRVFFIRLPLSTSIGELNERILFLQPTLGPIPLPLNLLPFNSGSDYYQPYFLPFGWPIPFEFVGPFVGCAAARPTVPKNEPAVSAEMWATCERIILAAGAARGGGSSAARG